MQRLDENVTRLTEEGLTLRLGTRTFAASETPTPLKEVAGMQVPQQLEVLSKLLLEKSKLLTLRLDAEDAAIFEAYAADLKLLVHYRSSFEKTIEAAIKARAPSSNEPAQEFLDRITKNVSEIVHEPTLDLGPDTLRLSSEERLLVLQGQFRADVTSFKICIAAWLHILVESEYVFLLDWINPKAVRYHFFRVEASRDELSRDVQDPGMNAKGRMVRTTTTTKTTVISERRAHTLVNAKEYALEEFYERVPKRIADFIDTIPAEMRQFVTIIGGTVTQEQVVRRTSSTQIETTTKAVWIDDPAVTLFGTFAIAGYGGSIPEGAHSLYSGHPVARQRKCQEKWSKYLLNAWAASVLLTFFVTNIKYATGIAVVGLIFVIASLKIIEIFPNLKKKETRRN